MQPTKTLLLYFSITGGPSYLSQQETLTMWSRALLRAGIEPAYSQGFNPHPKISLPLPRSVGVEGDQELLTVQTDTFAGSAEDLQRRMNVQLPEDCTVFCAEILEGKARRYPGSILYRFEPKSSCWTEAFRQGLEGCRRQIEAGDRVEMVRQRPDERVGRTVDIGVYLQAVGWDDTFVEVRCRFSGQGTARVEELLGWVGLRREDLCRPVLRTGIEWLTTGWQTASAKEEAEGDEVEPSEDSMDGQDQNQKP
jgi:radical SAM-linked protein